MREIEIKAQVRDLAVIRTKLSEKGFAVTDPVTQHDVVWGAPGVAGDSNNTSPWLRIRSETKGDKTCHIFTLKRSVTNQLDSIEHETEVAEPDQMRSIIDELGYVLYSDLTKTRQKAQMGDIEICLDTVDGLGDFIEAEKLVADDAEYQAVIDELWAQFDNIGIDRKDEVTDGYDVLMNKKLGKA